MRARGLVRSGAMRSLASFVHDVTPHVMGICEIDAGDALALATRFALEWAYRGRAALFWRAPFRASAVHDRYLPGGAARLFDRRGLLIVDADREGAPCTLAATQLGASRETFVPELRFARSQLRGALPALLFVDMPPYRLDFRDLGLQAIGEGIFARGFARAELQAAAATV